MHRRREAGMCNRCDEPYEHRSLSRRGALRFAAVAAATLATAHATVDGARAAKVAAPPKPANVLPPDAALDRLMKGNARYVDGVSRRHDFKHEREALSAGQNPFAAILSCADSRIAPEYCFDTGRGDIFVCRVAGNIASDEMIASLEYAVSVLNTPLIMVLAHESCGAVDAAIKSIKNGTTLPGHLPSLVEAIAPAVNAVQGQGGDMLANAIRRNATLNADKLKSSDAVLKSFVDDKKLRVVSALYALGSGRVELLA
jgi:carbonic anhydrase